MGQQCAYLSRAIQPGSPGPGWQCSSACPLPLLVPPPPPLRPETHLAPPGLGVLPEAPVQWGSSVSAGQRLTWAECSVHTVETRRWRRCPWPWAMTGPCACTSPATRRCWILAAWGWAEWVPLPWWQGPGLGKGDLLASGAKWSERRTNPHGFHKIVRENLWSRWGRLTISLPVSSVRSLQSKKKPLVIPHNKLHVGSQRGRL